MQKFLRQWHRWIGFPASIFLLFASVTGILLAFTEFFGEEEALREKTRSLVSPVTTQSPAAELATAFARAQASVAAQAPGAPVDQIVWQFKGETPTIAFFLGKPKGGEAPKHGEDKAAVAKGFPAVETEQERFINIGFGAKD